MRRKYAQYRQLPLNYIHDTQDGGRTAVIVHCYNNLNFRFYERGCGVGENASDSEMPRCEMLVRRKCPVTITYPSDSRSCTLTVTADILSPTFTGVDSDSRPTTASLSAGIQTTQGCGSRVIRYSWPLL
jgi:hypothetical protein